MLRKEKHFFSCAWSSYFSSLSPWSLDKREEPREQWGAGERFNPLLNFRMFLNSSLQSSHSTLFEFVCKCYFRGVAEAEEAESEAEERGAMWVFLNFCFLLFQHWVLWREFPLFLLFFSTLLPIDMVPVQCKHPTLVQWGEHVKNSHYHQGDMSSMGGGLLAGQGGRPCVGICYLRWRSRSSWWNNFELLQLWRTLIGCNFEQLWSVATSQEKDEPAPTWSQVGQALCWHLLHAEGQGGTLSWISMLRNITLFEGEDERGGFQGAGEACREKILCGTLLPH